MVVVLELFVLAENQIYVIRWQYNSDCQNTEFELNSMPQG